MDATRERRRGERHSQALGIDHGPNPSTTPTIHEKNAASNVKARQAEPDSPFCNLSFIRR